MTNYCFTGPRKLTYGEACKVGATLTKLKGESYHVGDASGADAVVRDMVERGKRTVYETEGKQPWQLAQRSKRMVDECAKLGNAKLIAYPNKPCPEGVKPSKNFKGCGSGTWGTIAYAKHLGLEIELHWLRPGLTEPDWLKQTQLSLL